MHYSRWFRHGDPLGTHGSDETGRYLCTCPCAQPKPAPSKYCASCGLLVVARLHPAAQTRAVAKHPWFARRETREAVTA